MKNKEIETWKRIYDFIKQRSKVDDKDYIKIKRELYEYYDDVREEMMREDIPLINPWLILHSIINYINELDEETGCEASIMNMDGVRKEADDLRDWENKLLMYVSNNRDMFRDTVDKWWSNTINDDRITSRAKEYLRNILIEIKGRYPYKK